MEEYLDKFSQKGAEQKNVKFEPSLIERIRKYTKRLHLPNDYDYKKVWHQHLDEEYGKQNIFRYKYSY